MGIIGSSLLAKLLELLEDAYPSTIRRSPSTPTGRWHHAMAYDSARHAVVLQGGLYGGVSSPVANETWELLTPDELVIELQPLSQFQPPGSNALFSVQACSRSGAALNYQWFFNSQPLSDGGNISGSQPEDNGGGEGVGSAVSEVAESV